MDVFDIIILVILGGLTVFAVVTGVRSIVRDLKEYKKNKEEYNNGNN